MSKKLKCMLILYIEKGRISKYNASRKDDEEGFFNHLYLPGLLCLYDYHLFIFAFRELL
jgi:hypothetical protein